MRKLFRNKFTYIVAMTLVCAMSLAACGNKNAKAETESKKAVQDVTESTKKAEKNRKDSTFRWYIYSRVYYRQLNVSCE